MPGSGIFGGSAVFKNGHPVQYAVVIAAKAMTQQQKASLLAEVSSRLGEAMVEHPVNG